MATNSSSVGGEDRPEIDVVGAEDFQAIDAVGDEDRHDNERVSGGNPGDGLKKGPWTAAEDKILVEYVRRHGQGNWNSVHKKTELARCGKSCRLRWTNHLKPNLKKGAFSLEEEQLIAELHAKLGNKWARMAAELPGRTDNEIKNYWNTRVKRRLRHGGPLYPPEAQAQIDARNRQNPLNHQQPVQHPLYIQHAQNHHHHHPYQQPQNLYHQEAQLRPVYNQANTLAVHQAPQYQHINQPGGPVSASSRLYAQAAAAHLFNQFSYDSSLQLNPVTYTQHARPVVQRQVNYGQFFPPAELPSNQVLQSERLFDNSIGGRSSGLLSPEKEKRMLEEFEEFLNQNAANPPMEPGPQQNFPSPLQSFRGVSQNEDDAAAGGNMDSMNEDLSYSLDFASALDIPDWLGNNGDLSINQPTIAARTDMELQFPQLPSSSLPDCGWMPGSSWNNFLGNL